jgi:hypothetical protein
MARLDVAQPVALRVLVDVERDVLAVGRVLGERIDLGQDGGRGDLGVEAPRVRATQDVRGVVDVAGQVGVDDAVDDRRVDQRAGAPCGAAGSTSSAPG